MKLVFVADVGNSRIKWGRCRGGRIGEAVSLPPDDPQAWHDQLEILNISDAAKLGKVDQSRVR